MRKNTIALIVLAAMMVAGASQARPRSRAATQPKLFIGASGAAAWLPRADSSFSNSIVSTDAGKSFGGSVTYGAIVVNGFSAELDFEWITGHALEQTTAISTTTADLTTYALTASMLYHPLARRFDPFIGFGGGWMRAAVTKLNASGDGLVLRWTTGVNVWLSESFGVRLEGRYTLPITKEIKDFDSVAPRAGIFYRF